MTDSIAEKSFRIKHDDSSSSSFLSRLISKDSANNTSSRVFYYGEKSVAVPFIWEAQPGTPKHPFSHTSLPPLTPPPSYAFSNSKNAKFTRNSKRGKNKNVNSIVSIIWPIRFGGKLGSTRVIKARGGDDVSSSNWSLSSSSLSSSSSTNWSLPQHQQQQHSSHSRSHSCSSNSTMDHQFPNLKHKWCCSHGLIRGCYPFGNHMKNATV